MSRALADLELSLSPGAVLGIEQEVLPYRLVEGLKKNLEGVKLENLSPVVLKQRLVKDDEEVARIRKAVELWEIGHEAIMETLAVGVAEYEVAAAMECAARRGGGGWYGLATPLGLLPARWRYRCIRTQCVGSLRRSRRRRLPA